MIPKYIHYCWFGGNKIPKRSQIFIDSWKKKFPDYTFILWNEDNFPIDEFGYARQAYDSHKYSFVSDVARVFALNKYGGIYLDTDVDVIKSPEVLFGDNSIILGWETANIKTVGTGFIAAMPEEKICNWLLDYYKNASFLNEDGSYNLKSNTELLGGLLVDEYKFEPKNTVQNKDGIMIYSNDYFTAYDFWGGRVHKTKNTHAIHYFEASWLPKKNKMKRFIKVRINKFIHLFKKNK